MRKSTISNTYEERRRRWSRGGAGIPLYFFFLIFLFGETWFSSFVCLIERRNKAREILGSLWSKRGIQFVSTSVLTHNLFVFVMWPNTTLIFSHMGPFHFFLRAIDIIIPKSFNQISFFFFLYLETINIALEFETLFQIFPIYSGRNYTKQREYLE